MINVYNVIDGLSIPAMRYLLTRMLGYTLREDLSERGLRQTIIADFEYGLLSRRDICDMEGE